MASRKKAKAKASKKPAKSTRKSAVKKIGGGFKRVGSPPKSAPRASSKKASRSSGS